MPTELLDATGDRLSEAGQEFGTVTGRRRRCGWLDLAALKYVTRLAGIHGLACTRLDTLDGFDQVGVCVGYDGVPENTVLDAETLARAQPRYEWFEGWSGTSGTRHWHMLPRAARKYLEFIANSTSTEIAMVSTGPGREETMVLSDTITQFCRTKDPL